MSPEAAKGVAEEAEPGAEPARTESHLPPAGPSRGVRTGAGWLLVICAAFFGATLATCGYHALFGLSGEEEETGITVRPTPSVVVAVRDLARLESASYHIERVVDLRDRQEHLFGLIEAEDAILLVAAGDVVAGVDLSRLGEEDVVVDAEAGTATVTLPPPEVLMARLDSDRTFVHTRETGILARRNEDLETRARQEAERTIREAAIEAGVLDRARRNSRRTVESLVRSLGYENVTVRFADE